jgi:pimeloyl-ACP methyl ester carboxylesterase
MKNVYILSGLGADKRVFKYITFKNVHVTFINWVIPTPTNISIEAYAQILTAQIVHTKPVIIGLSFGGMMAMEIAKIIEVEKVILIASAKTKGEIPFYFKFAGSLSLHKLLPINALKRPTKFTQWFFGTKNNSAKLLIAEILKDTNPVFLKWAIDKIVNWKNTVVFKNTIHIHGTQDKLLPIFFTKPDIKVRYAGHFLTVNNAKEISEILNELIKN